MNTNDSARRMFKLRNLDLSQKLLVATILTTVGIGYMSALANIFEQHASADGKQSIRLNEFASVYHAKGVGGLIAEVQNSLGIQDVIKRYYGDRETTHMQTALAGVMRPILEENEEPEDVDRIYQELAEWSKLPAKLRQIAYEKGVPLNETTAATDFAKLQTLFDEDGNHTQEISDEIEWMPIKETFEMSCIGCHSPNGEASEIPLDSYAAVDHFCESDHGMPVGKLAMSSHLHLLGTSVLFGMTGLLFSMTSWPHAVRLIFAPATLFFQLVEVSCWWFAKLDVTFAMAIFYLGPIIGVCLGVQIVGTLLDLAIHRARCVDQCEYKFANNPLEEVTEP